EGKATHTVLELLLEHESEEARAILARRASREGDVERMAELAIRSGASEATRREIAAKVAEARAALEAFPASPERSALAELAGREGARVS
ncbi:MAG TPA: polyprenyl synthetase family protein, partial [Trueperaceae bacterium]|nr:polyprenyl synthetase family protein [Trueperaceae bacterium]